MANWIITDIPRAKGHDSSCKCRGLGYTLVPTGEPCNCGSGEGCGNHSDFWMDEKTCDGKEKGYWEKTP